MTGPRTRLLCVILVLVTCSVFETGSDVGSENQGALFKVEGT